MTGLQAIILAIVQGITELFPISSLGHAVLLPALLNWNVDENAEGFLPFLAVMHLGTAVALLGYFWRDWLAFAGGVLRFGDARSAVDRRLFWRVVAATLPAVVIGFVFEKKLKAGFGAPILAATFLVVNGVMLFAAERLRRGGERRLDQLSWTQAVIIGFWQCLALIPGMSRSGATMAGGHLCGLNHEDAARFSFLTATPIILGAVALEAPKLVKHHSDFSSTALLAGVVAGVTALASVWALMKWFKTHEVKGFDPFALYCALVGAGAFAWLMLGR
ncbi:MAG TPA: undecaprenyl-diphosphate phosphatase [Caulobacteraceae bacterium]